jgi:hypothetical protein
MGESTPPCLCLAFLSAAHGSSGTLTGWCSVTIRRFGLVDQRLGADAPNNDTNVAIRAPLEWG